MSLTCPHTGAGRTKSVFDIFREDVVGDVGSTAVENSFLEVGELVLLIPTRYFLNKVCMW